MGTTLLQQILPLVFSILVGLTYFFTNKFNVKRKKYYHQIVSFSAGLSITYVLLDFFPEFTEGAIKISRFLFITVLFGFIIHHLIEKYIYQHNSRTDLRRVLSFEENVFSFIYHIILGFLLVTFSEQSIVQGILLFIPIMSYTFASTLPTNPHKSIKKGILLSSSTFIGSLIATFLWTVRQPWLEFSLYGLTLGVLLFTVIRHHIPYGRKGKVTYFMVGFVVYSLIIIASWYM